MKFSLRLGTTILATTAMFACSGGGSSSSNSASTTAPTPTASTAPSASTPTPSPAPAAVTISIVGSSGTNAFSPNPSTVASGAAVMFKNNDSTTHHIVMDNGSADLGDLAPGATTRSVTVASGNFHCTIHPTMVGSINGALPNTTPAPSPSDPTYPYSWR